MPFQKATKIQARGRLALCGPSGSGKTYTALRVAQALKGEGRIAVIDTEAGSASKYADLWDFDTDTLEEFSPKSYIEKIHDAESQGYSVIICDSVSDAWEGEGGILAMHDDAARRSRSDNTYFAWRDVTPEHNALFSTIIRSSAHMIVTIRSDTAYVIEERSGKHVPVKIGMKPIQRKGVEYKFDAVVDLDMDLNATVGKTRCPGLSRQVFQEAGENDLGKIFYEWLTDGAPALMGDGERRQIEEAIRAHLLAEGITNNLLGDCYRAVMKSFGVEKGSELPVEKLSDVKRAIEMWQPEEGGE